MHGTHRFFSPLGKILLHFFLLSLFMREAFIVRSDGPGGWGEMVLKSLLLMVCWAVFLLSSTVLLVAAQRGKQAAAKQGIFIFASIWLALCAALAVVEACSDSRGYCQNWGWFF